MNDLCGRRHEAIMRLPAAIERAVCVHALSDPRDLPILLVFIFCMINPIARTIFRALGDCSPFEYDDFTEPPTRISFLRLDLRVECNTAEHASIRAVCWTCFLLWPFGCLLLYLVLLLRARRAVLTHKPSPLARATRFLWQEYRAEWMLWELLDMLRRLTLCGFVLFVPAEQPKA